MIQNLQAYLEVNEIQNQETLLELGQYLLDNQDKSLLTYARQGYILAGFVQLVKWVRDLEKFMQMGDVFSKEPLSENHHWSHAGAYIMTQLESNDMYATASTIIVEQSIVDDYAHTNVLLQKLAERDSTLITIS